MTLSAITRLGLCLGLLSSVISATAARPRQTDVESYKYEVGGSLGMSGYLGDANESSLFDSPGFAASVQGRYLIDSRWAVSARLAYATISGNTSQYENALPFGKQYKFTSSLYDVSVRGEVNFFAFGIGETYRKLKRISPYMAVGIGTTIGSCGGYTSGAFSVPLALGVKYKLSQRVNMSAEFSLTKVFGDKIDGEHLTDLTLIKSSFLKNTDWFSTLTVGISYEFGPRCATCNRID